MVVTRSRPRRTYIAGAKFAQCCCCCSSKRHQRHRVDAARKTAWQRGRPLPLRRAAEDAAYFLLRAMPWRCALPPSRAIAFDLDLAGPLSGRCRSPRWSSRPARPSTCSIFLGQRRVFLAVSAASTAARVTATYLGARHADLPARRARSGAGDDRVAGGRRGGRARAEAAAPLLRLWRRTLWSAVWIGRAYSIVPTWRRQGRRRSAPSTACRCCRRGCSCRSPPTLAWSWRKHERQKVRALTPTRPTTANGKRAERVDGVVEADDEADRGSGADAGATACSCVRRQPGHAGCRRASRRRRRRRAPRNSTLQYSSLICATTRR